MVDASVKAQIDVYKRQGQMDLAERKLLALTELVKPWHENAAEWGFNEWIHAQTGKPVSYTHLIWRTD